MNTETFYRDLKATQAAREAARHRRQRATELKALFTAGTLVITGLFIATIYSLLTHQIPL